MSYKFSASSKARLQTCHRDIQAIMEEVMAHTELDFTIVCGRRGEDAQEAAFNTGKSRAHYGQSPHNADPSLAVDVAPYRDGAIQWENELLFQELSGMIKAANVKLLGDEVVQIKLEQIGTWDAPHWQIKGWKNMVGDL